MLNKILSIQGVGLFHDVQASSFKFEKNALIYAENGRGKSTLSSIFRSLRDNDSSVISSRQTLDGTIDPNIKMLFDDGHKITFNDFWSEGKPEIAIFDTDFIDRNVNSGGGGK